MTHVNPNFEDVNNLSATLRSLPGTRNMECILVSPKRVSYVVLDVYGVFFPIQIAIVYDNWYFGT